MTSLPSVVLFGASGFIGQNIVEALSGRVEMLVGVSGSRRSVHGCTHCLPIDDLASIPHLPNDAVLINVAAYRYHAGLFRSEQSLIMSRNVAIANAVYQFCIDRRISEVRLGSSIAVYPAIWALLDEDKTVDLNAWPHAGEAGYAWSKRWAEICAEVHRRQAGINTQVFRLSNPYGPYDSTDVTAAHVAAAFAIKALMPGDTFEILGNADAERDFVFAGDVARTLVASLGRREINETYNLGFGRTFTIRQLAEAAIKAAGVNKRIVVAATAPEGVSLRRVNVAKVHRDLAPGAFADLNQGMAATVAWYRHALGS
jgi:nucleoside-diphosphate-sugar epimerase